jgi:hypothetical protein
MEHALGVSIDHGAGEEETSFILNYRNRAVDWSYTLGNTPADRIWRRRCEYCYLRP